MYRKVQSKVANSALGGNMIGMRSRRKNATPSRAKKALRVVAVCAATISVLFLLTMMWRNFNGDSSLQSLPPPPLPLHHEFYRQAGVDEKYWPQEGEQEWLDRVAKRREEEARFGRVVSAYCPVTSDVHGNLGPPQVITAIDLGPPGQGRDWIKERWQAAKDMSGSPIPGPHWVEIDLQQEINISRVAISFEAAYSDDYELQCRRGVPHSTYEKLEIASFKSTSSGAGESSLVLHDLYLEAEAGLCRNVRLHMFKPSTAFGVSIWEMKVYGFGRRGGCGEEE